MTDKRSDNDPDKKKDTPDHHDEPTDTSDNTNGDQDISRRRFIKNTGMVAGGVVGGSLLGGLLTNQYVKDHATKTKSHQEKAPKFLEARQFFHRLEDFSVLAAATECIFPKDDNGPGAIELDVPYFIDKQLAGQWGVNSKDYRHAPYMTRDNKKGLGSDGQADQSIMDRGKIFINGVRKLNEESQKRFKKAFNDASEDQQIKVLKDFDDNKIKMKGVQSMDFFALLRQSTLEGAYSDPLYGGNKNMAGWEMKNFPGSQPSYTNIIDKKEFVKIKPMSLQQYQGH